MRSMQVKFKSRMENFVVRFWPYLLILLTTCLMIWGQVGRNSFVMSIDTWFHYNRFYDVSQQIKNHSFNYFQMNYGFSQSGRIINALYGPLFAYLMGFLVLITGTWYNFQILTYFIICLLGGAGMYQLVKKTNANKIWSILLALIYINISPIQSWFDHSNLAGWGAALVPYAFIEAFNMIQDPKKPIRWIRLMLIMALIAQTHLLSTLIVAAGLVPFAIVGFVRASHQGQMIKDLTKSVIGCLCLTANVWGALLIINGSNELAKIRKHNLAPNALHISDLGTNRNKIMALTLIILIIQVVYVLATFKKSVLNNVATLVGAFFLLISSKLLPWENIQDQFPVLGHYLQFPFRFTPIAFCLLLAGIGMSIKDLSLKDSKWLYYTVLTALGVVLIQNINANYTRLVETSNNNHLPVYRITNKKYYQTNNPYQQNDYITTVKGFKDGEQTYGIINSEYGTHYVHVFTTENRFYRNTTDRDAFNRAIKTNKHQADLFKLIIKVNPDYLPISKKYDSTFDVTHAFEKEIIDRENDFKKKVLPDGSLKISWNAEGAGERQLPIVMYKQSNLRVNGKNVNPKKYSLISAPTIEQKVGKNTAILSFNWPMTFKILFSLTLISWTILLIYGIKYFRSKKLRVKEVIK